ncbi:MAG TPA: FAD-dependent oxidoreductase [Thermodesulfobacteriota bacterium]
MSSKRIIIIGGGFAGVKCAKTLFNGLPKEEYEIVLFNSENYMVFQPLLAEVVGASINPDSVAVSLRQLLPGVLCRTEDINKINFVNDTVEYEGSESRVGVMSYDHLVIASGSVVNLGVIPGMADHTFPLKNVGDAIALRYHIMQQLENGEVCDDPELRRWYLSFIVVGGGFSGVEVAGEINDLVRETQKFYKNIRPDDISVTIIHSRDQLLPEVTTKLRDFAKVKMEEAGIKIVLNTSVSFVTPQGVGISGDTFMQGATVVSTIGNAISQFLGRLDVPKERGRILTEPDMRVKGCNNVWAIGDCAHIVNSFDGNPSPPTGQFAERQGRLAANNMIRVLNEKKTKPFYFKPIGQLCAIGGHNAVAEIFGMHISGFIAWFFWRTVYMFKLPSLSHRIKVGFDWAWDLFYSRDLAHPKADPTDRISRAHYQPGDCIFMQGDPGTNFYVIESGEVEVIRNGEEGKSRSILAVLGPGDFFGEMALIDNHPRNATIRARTAVEVLVMGRNVFQQISSTMAPFREILANAVRRRSGYLWQRFPLADEILKNQPFSSFVEHLDVYLHPESTFEDALNLLSEKSLEYCCVVDNDNTLKGILTRTDFVRAVDSGVKRHTKVREFMKADPIIVTVNEETPSVAATMRLHDIKWMPVVEDLDSRKIKGYVRIDRIMKFVLQHLPQH